MRKKQEKVKKDVRKIHQFFRAVEKDDNPKTYYCYLISDDGFNVVCFGAHDLESSHLKERVLQKNEFNFTKINLVEFEYFVKRAIFHMNEDASDKRFLLDAAQHNVDFAESKLKELIGR